MIGFRDGMSAKKTDETNYTRRSSLSSYIVYIVLFPILEVVLVQCGFIISVSKEVCASECQRLDESIHQQNVLSNLMLHCNKVSKSIDYIS
jgi:nitrate reductase NapE component